MWLVSRSNKRKCIVCSVNVMILLASVTQRQAKELVVRHASDAQMDLIADKLVDKLVARLDSQTIGSNRWILDNENLDSTTTGKTRQASIPQPLHLNSLPQAMRSSFRGPVATFRGLYQRLPAIPNLPRLRFRPHPRLEATRAAVVEAPRPSPVVTPTRQWAEIEKQIAEIAQHERETAVSAAAVTLPFPSTLALKEIEVCEIMCHGKLLSETQTLGGGIFADGKYFVDMPLRSDPKDVLASFNTLPRQDDGRLLAQELKHFVAEHFGPAGTDLEAVEPEDWQASPAFLSDLTDGALRDWATDVHALWKGLLRRPVRDVMDYPQRHTLLWTPHPFVVPGGRFRESYYWDSHWIVQGLLVSGMNVTARGVVENLLSFVERFGFVPNGGRSYYLRRSQPPMLSEMVLVIADDLNKRGLVGEATSFIQRALPVLEKEHRFWLEKRTVQLDDGLFLSHYDSESSLPRPESYREDVEVLSRAESRDPRSLFRAIAAGAESGWDFTSRWLADGQSMSSIDTTSVFPVDLNSILLRMELNLRNMHLALGDNDGASKYGSFAKARHTAMKKIMWSESHGCWRDVNRDLSQRNRKDIKDASSFTPLWALARMEDATFVGANVTQVGAAVSALGASGLIRPAGVVTTSEFTGQQWDSPNAWAPLQQMLVEGLTSGPARDVGGAALGKQIARSWVETNLKAWQTSNFMYEKYNADEVGQGGGGGEYVPQTGFGWTNGVALVLLSQYYSLHNSFRTPAAVHLSK